MTNAASVRQAAETIAAAVRAQHSADLHCADFCALALATGQALDALFNLNSSIGRQLARYQDGRRLLTSTDRTPSQVISAAMYQGRILDGALRKARQAAQAMADECAQLTAGPTGDS